MAHFALINQDNIVEQVIVIADSEEQRGQEFINNELGLDGIWIQTSVTNRIRKAFAQPGYSYLPDLDVFKPNKPAGLDSFVFNEELWNWVTPVSMPIDDQNYFWDESTISWQVYPEFPPSWINGKAPVKAPNDGKTYSWNEDLTSWEEVPLPKNWFYNEEGIATAPIPMPDNGNMHYWDPEIDNWVDTQEALLEIL